MKGLHCLILQPKTFPNCSNHGISERCSEITLVGEGIPEIFEATDQEPPVIIETRKVFGTTYYHAVPVKIKESGKWYMMGGCFIWTSDSRFPHDYPIPLHDRVEN